MCGCVLHFWAFLAASLKHAIRLSTIWAAFFWRGSWPLVVRTDFATNPSSRPGSRQDSHETTGKAQTTGKTTPRLRAKLPGNYPKKLWEIGREKREKPAKNWQATCGENKQVEGKRGRRPKSKAFRGSMRLSLSQFSMFARNERS